MESKYKYIEITNKDCLDFFENSYIKNCFDNGGWIAGGFPRLLTILFCNQGQNSRTNYHYFLTDYLYNQDGDVDFFFSNKKALEKSMSVISSYNSLYCHNIFININKYKEKSIKIQLVEKFMYENAEETLKSFDFLNCEYAIVRKDFKYFIIYNVDALENDNKNTLVIKHINSPYTLSRVSKYFKSKNIKHLSENSVDILKNLIVNLAAENFDENVYQSSRFFNAFTQKSLDILIEKTDLINEEDILYFLGKFKEYEFLKYGEVVTVDWALDTIQNKF